MAINWVNVALVGVACGVGMASGGCTVDAEVHPVVPVATLTVTEPVVYTEPPPLVTIDDKVSVVENAEYPTYYENGAYWSYRGGVWYHTARWSDAWVKVEVHQVPEYVVHRDHTTYAHYHAPATVKVWREPAKVDVTVKVDDHHEEHHDDHHDDHAKVEVKVDEHAKGKVEEHVKVEEHAKTEVKIDAKINVPTAEMTVGAKKKKPGEKDDDKKDDKKDGKHDDKHDDKH